MSFVPGFDYDVFVSYAHADNQLPQGTAARHGWVSALSHNLNTGIGAVHKTIFIDHQLRPGDPFGDELRTKVAKSAVLVILLSRTYAESKWCGIELDHFIRTRSEDVAHPRNVVAVELTPFSELETNPDSHIANLRHELILAQFWAKPINAADSELFGWPSPQESQYRTEYFSAVGRLSAAIDRRLRTIRTDHSALVKQKSISVDIPANATIPVPLSQTEKSDAPAILLADVTDDLADDREELRTFLEKEGVRVLPEGVYVGRSKAEFEQAFDAHIQQSILFVQLLSRAAGQKIRDLDLPVPQLQFARAKAAPISMLQWGAPELKIEQIRDPAHADLFRTEHIQLSNLEQFKSQVLLRYQDLCKARRASTKISAVAAPRNSIFLDDALADAKVGQKLRDLLKGEGCEIRSMPKNAGLGHNGFPLTELLRPCRGAVLVYSDRKDQITAFHRLHYFINQVADQRLSMSRWGVYVGEHLAGIDLRDEFGIDSPDVVTISGADDGALLNFVRGLA